MSTFKRIDKQDIFVSDYIARKSWNIPHTQFAEYGISTLYGISGSTGEWEGIDQNLIYNNIRYQYYPSLPGYYDIVSSSRDLSYQSTSALQEERTLSDQVFVIALPNSTYGTHIEPGTVFGELITQDSINFEDVDGKLKVRYPFVFGETEFTAGQTLGDVIYNQGHIIISENVSANLISRIITGDLQSTFNLYWNSNLPIFTLNARCKVKSSEFAYTYNPTAVTGSDNVLRTNVTGSEFTPYVTSIGLYNNSQELVAIAKVNRPVPLSKDMDTTFVIQIDI